MAIGLLGIGSGLGFFFGPQIAGWVVPPPPTGISGTSPPGKNPASSSALPASFGLIFLVVASDVPGKKSGPEHLPIDLKGKSEM